MTDLSGLSDADLMNGYATAKATAPTPDPRMMSDAQLTQAYNATKNAQPSTMGYIGSRFLGGLIEGGNALGNASAIEMGQPDMYKGQPPGQQTVDQAIYGQPSVTAPNATARYGGAVASAFGANPVMGALAPGYTVAGALGGEGGSDLNKAWGPSWLPDWAARLAGGVVGGGIYGAGKAIASGAVDTATGVDREVQRAQELRARVDAGEGRIGEFQQTAKTAADSISEANNPMPSVPSYTPVQLPNTLDVLTRPGGGPIPEGADKLIKALPKDTSTLPYSSVVQWQKEFADHPELYNALKADRKLAIVAQNGPEAAAAFDQANAASRARYFLDQSKTPQGLYDPLKLTRNLARDPTTGQFLSDVTPQMSALAVHAGQLSDLVSPLANANAPRASMLGRTLAAGGGLLAEHSGLPGASLIGGMLFEHGGGRAPNPIYALPNSPLIPRILPPATAIAASQSGLLNR